MTGKSSPINPTNYAMLYPQNGGGIVAIDSVTSHHPSICIVCGLGYMQRSGVRPSVRPSISVSSFDSSSGVRRVCCWMPAALTGDIDRQRLAPAPSSKGAAAGTAARRWAANAELTRVIYSRLVRVSMTWMCVQWASSSWSRAEYSSLRRCGNSSGRRYSAPWASASLWPMTHLTLDPWPMTRMFLGAMGLGFCLIHNLLTLDPWAMWPVTLDPFDPCSSAPWASAVWPVTHVTHDHWPVWPMLLGAMGLDFSLALDLWPVWPLTHMFLGAMGLGFSLTHDPSDPWPMWPMTLDPFDPCSSAPWASASACLFCSSWITTSPERSSTAPTTGSHYIAPVVERSITIRVFVCLSARVSQKPGVLNFNTNTCTSYARPNLTKFFGAYPSFIPDPLL